MLLREIRREPSAHAFSLKTNNLNIHNIKIKKIWIFRTFTFKWYEYSEYSDKKKLLREIRREPSAHSFSSKNNNLNIQNIHIKKIWIFRIFTFKWSEYSEYSD